MPMLLVHCFRQAWLPFWKGTQAKFLVLGDTSFFMAGTVRLWYGYGTALVRQPQGKCTVWYDNPDVRFARLRSIGRGGKFGGQRNIWVNLRLSANVIKHAKGVIPMNS